jgi:AraC-like DNA-binding protein
MYVTVIKFMKNDIQRHHYFPVDDAAMAAGLYLTGSGRERYKPFETYPHATHPRMYMFSWNSGRILPEYQLVYIQSGTGEFESHATGRIEVSAGTALLLLPDVWHRYRPTAKTGWTEMYLSFNGQIPHIWQLTGLITRQNPVRRVNTPVKLAESMGAIIELAGNNPTMSPQQMALLTLGTLALVLGGSRPVHQNNTVDSAPPERVPTQDLIVNAGLHLIWNQSHRNLSVHDIAGKLGVQRRTLARHFLSVRGRNVLAEITSCRVARAQRMLRETRLPVKRIAYAAGFNSPTHLAVVFRREIGLSPREYREKGMADLPEPALRQ